MGRRELCDIASVPFSSRLQLRKNIDNKFFTAQRRMKSVEIFERFCSEFGLGKRLDIENYPDVPAFPLYDHTRKVANDLIGSALVTLPRLPNIHFDFVESPSINAFAAKSEGEYLIGITAGAVLMIHLVLDRVMTSPMTFPDIGDAALERHDIVPVPWEILDASKLFSIGVRSLGALDEKRRIYSTVLADQALMFLVGHEIAHISRGHVDYDRAVSGKAFLSELSWNGTGNPNMERQAMEVDADRRSVYARCHSANVTALNTAGKIPQWANGPVTAQRFQYEWMFAANVLFRLFGDKRFSKVSLEADLYPPLPIRRRIALDHAANVLTDNWKEGTQELIREAIVGAISASEYSFTVIGAPVPGGGFEDAFSGEANEHILEISRCYKSMLPELKKHTYESLD